MIFWKGADWVKSQTSSCFCKTQKYIIILGLRKMLFSGLLNAIIWGRNSAYNRDSGRNSVSLQDGHDWRRNSVLSDDKYIWDQNGVYLKVDKIMDKTTY